MPLRLFAYVMLHSLLGVLPAGSGGKYSTMAVNKIIPSKVNNSVSVATEKPTVSAVWDKY